MFEEGELKRGAKPNSYFVLLLRTLQTPDARLYKGVLIVNEKRRERGCVLGKR